MREFSVPASFTVGEHDNVVSSVYSHERDDPDHVIFQRLVDGVWTDVTCRQAAGQIRSAALGLIAEGVQPGDRVAILSATRYEWPILDFAILSIGAVTVPIYETSPRPSRCAGCWRTPARCWRSPRPTRTRGMVEELRDELPAAAQGAAASRSRAPSALDALAEAGASVDAERARRAAGGHQVHRPGDADLHLGHHRPAQGLPADPLQPAATRSAAPRTASPTCCAKGERLLVFLPLAHVLARALTIDGLRQQGDDRLHQRHQEPGADARRCSSRRSWCRCRGCSRRSTTPPSRTPRTAARARSSRSRPQTAIDWSKAQDTGGAGPAAAAKHAVFDRLVYGKLRAALGGNCRARDLRRRPAGRAARPLLPRRRADHLRGLRPHRDQRGDHRQPDRRAQGRHRRKAVARQQHGGRRRRRAAGQGRRGVRRLLAQREGHQRGDRRRLVPHRRPRRDRRRRLPVDHRPQEGDHRDRGRQERRPRGARGPAARPSADQPGDGRRRRASRSSPR